MGNPEETPGFQFQISLAVAIVDTWEVMQDLLPLFPSRSAKSAVKTKINQSPKKNMSVEVLK